MRKELLVYMKHGQMIEMIYMSGDESISKRRISIRRVQSDRVYAYCYLRHAYRTFYSDRILALFPVKYRKKEVELYEYQ